MSSVEITPSAEAVYQWVKSKIEDRSHSCDAVWMLVSALDRTSQGTVGGNMDLRNRGANIQRPPATHPFQLESAINCVYRAPYTGNPLTRFLKNFFKLFFRGRLYSRTALVFYPRRGSTHVYYYPHSICMVGC